jgi:hypothetical protein
MSPTIYRAIMRNGVAVPVEPFEVADGTEVFVSISLPEGDGQSDENQNEIFEILSRRHSSGHTDTAARHNEHQP